MNVEKKEVFTYQQSIDYYFSLVCNHIHDLGVCLKWKYWVRAKESRMRVACFFFLFPSCWVSSLVFFDSFPYHNLFLNHFRMQSSLEVHNLVHNALCCLNVVFPVILQENSPSLSLFNVPLLQFLYFQCWWMRLWPFISNQKTVTLFLQPFTYSISWPFTFLFTSFPFSHIWTSSLSQLSLFLCIISILMWQLTPW